MLSNISIFLFLLTPIIWYPEMMPAGSNRGHLMRINPFYHLVEIFRAPIMGQPVETMSFWYVGIMTVVGLVVATFAYRRYARFVPFGSDDERTHTGRPTFASTFPLSCSASGRRRAGRGLFLGAAFDPPKRRLLRLLDDISFELNEGDRLAILGRNGAGKSTLLRVLNRVYQPSQGSLAIDGSLPGAAEHVAGLQCARRPCARTSTCAASRWA